jgi:hypothetical protein
MERLPQITDAEARYVAERLYETEMQHVSFEAAKVLVFAVKLHLLKRKWPTRQGASRHIGVSLPLHDMVISQRTASGHLKLTVVTNRGIVRRYLKPSDELIAWVSEITPNEG